MYFPSMREKVPNVDVPKEIGDWKGILRAAGGDVRRLDYVNRFSGIPVSFMENVSAHSFWVCLYAAMIHRHLLGFQEPGIDMYVMIHGLTHDIPECLTGDVVRTFKYSTPELKRAIDSAEEKLAENLPEEIKFFVKAISDTVSPEDQKYVKSVVKAADFMSLFQYMNREWNRGNVEIRPFMERMREDLMKQCHSLSSGNWYEEALSHLYRAMSYAVYNEPPKRST